ncbi:histidine kinase [Candidatus Marinarcus aquaticus]|uniref:histidine kinase n=2 Tax=Candidatus Marinarcus aquaticus TaxID=2044504 RepID=A0A4Q0XQJ4_9BACT|nr:histidine kinase [Candidatus Marinarcus aquaticus]
MYDMNVVLFYGATFGIVAMTILYTFIRYVYSKEWIYLIYSIMQIFSLLFIVAYSQLFFQNLFIEDVSITFASLFAFAFAIGFYQGEFIPKIENQKELFIYTVILIALLLTAFYHYMLFEYLPYTVIYFVLFVSVAFNFKQEIKPTLIYVLGWSLFCLFLYFTDFKQSYVQEGFLDIVLVAFAIEAVLFTLSIAYTYRALHFENQQYQARLVHQTRLAQSGQMIGNITHQWRQPLNNISYILINLKKAFSQNRLTQAYWEKKVQQVQDQLNFMSTTIDDFNAFYTPNKEKESFFVHTVIQQALRIVDSEFKQKGIETQISVQNTSIKIVGASNELAQVLVILLSNAKDALMDVEHPKVVIRLKSSPSEVFIEVEDNGSGIKQFDKIFQPYFSTKEEGLGIGLSMVKTIVEESFQGKVNASNSAQGALFCLKFEKAI